MMEVASRLCLFHPGLQTYSILDTTAAIQRFAQPRTVTSSWRPNRCANQNWGLCFTLNGPRLEQRSSLIGKGNHPDNFLRTKPLDFFHFKKSPVSELPSVFNHFSCNLKSDFVSLFFKENTHFLF